MRYEKPIASIYALNADVIATSGGELASNELPPDEEL